MASGCQLVVPNLKPITKYDFKATKFFKSGDIKDLSNTIIDSLKNIDQGDIEYNLNKVRSDYNWENNSYKLIELYDRVLS
jgi:Glycosyltransferase